MHFRVLKELADVVAKLLSIIFENLWPSGEVPDDWKKGSVIPMFRKSWKDDPGNYWLVSFTSAPRKIILEADPPGRYAKAYEGERGDTRKPSWFHQGQAMPNKFGGLLWWSYRVSELRKRNWHHLLGFVQNTWFCPTQHPCLQTGETQIGRTD